jgi:hypothetical protein
MLWRKRPKLFLLLLLFTILVISWFIWGIPEDQPEQIDSVQVVHAILGQEESCMDCHASTVGFSPFHNPENIGCTPCHGGNPYANSEKEAHRNMILVPGNLSDVHQTCGAANCHGDIAHRVDQSLMTTMAGAITVNRFAFGEIDTLTAYAHVKELGIAHASDVHFRQLCASCHLGNPKTKPAPVSELSRGGGCIACHLDYSDKNNFDNQSSGEKPDFHPAISIKVTNDHCFGCHSRSGRIATNYEGWHETKLSKEAYQGQDHYRLLQDGRVFEAMPADVHHELGLECIDCHSANELMGDGTTYLHEEDAVKISCQDCHFSQPAGVATYNNLDVESKKIINIRQQFIPDSNYIVNKKSQQAIWNVLLDPDHQAYLIQKNNGKRHRLSPPDEQCTAGSAHDALSCSSCHTGWAPQCVGCHNTFDPDETAFDLFAKEKTDGKWVEHLGEFFAAPPTLGVVLDEEQVRSIEAFIPGMIISIDKNEFPYSEDDDLLFHRLFAPVAPHTIQKVGRSCTSCHNNPLAIGYGRGELNYNTKGKNGYWEFKSEYADTPEDGLPQDAWIGFLRSPSNPAATRPNARPFTVAEQQSILTVGACLNCHSGSSTIMEGALFDFEEALNNKSDQCVVPDFRKKR